MKMEEQNHELQYTGEVGWLIQGRRANGAGAGLNPRHLDYILLFHLWFQSDASYGVQERMPG